MQRDNPVGSGHHQLALDPLKHFDYSGGTCIKHLLEPSTNHLGQYLLDELLYSEVQEARGLFSQALVEQPISTPVEYFTIRSLITLRQQDE